MIEKWSENQITAEAGVNPAEECQMMPTILPRASTASTRGAAVRL